MSENFYPDIMVDLETTGTDQANNAIIQLAACKFNLKEGTVSHDFFDRCLLMAPKRYWQEDCRSWWAKRKDVLEGIWGRMEDPAVVLRDFSQWAGLGCTFWGKPISFDFSFLQSYYMQFDMQIPFHYRYANDMNTFIRARYFPEEPKRWEQDLPFDGDAHNALADVLHQVKVLFHAYNDTKG